jgi:hypothetical protein
MAEYLMLEDCYKRRWQSGTPGSSYGLLTIVWNLFSVNSLALYTISRIYPTTLQYRVKLTLGRLKWFVVTWLVVWLIMQQLFMLKTGTKYCLVPKSCECNLSSEHRLCMPVHHTKFKQRSLCGMKPVKGLRQLWHCVKEWLLSRWLG